MSRDIQIKLVTDFEAFEKLHPAWDILIENSPSQDVFLTWEWFYAWFRSYGRDSNIRVVTAWDKTELIGLAPFMLIKQKKYGFTFRVLRTLSAPQCDVGGFLIKNNALDTLSAIIDYLVVQKGQWDLLEFNQFYVNGLEAQTLIEKLPANGFTCHQTTNKHFYIPYEGNWDDYQAHLNSRFRKNLRRSQRGLDVLGKHTVQHVKGKEVTWDTIQAIIEVNRHATFPLICVSENDQALHRELIHVMAEKGWVDIYILTLDNKPIAYEYGFLYKGRMGDWRVGFDRRVDPTVSVGVFLTMAVLKIGFDEKQKEIDFLRGDEGYKNDWRPAYREYVHIKAARIRNPLAALAFIWLPKIKLSYQKRMQQSQQTELDE
jgi:CelD/BcsL family acetyltransferase involved in cellulose biosynthesis